MKIIINLGPVSPSTSKAADLLLKELIKEVSEHVADCDEFDALSLVGHLELIETLKPLATHDRDEREGGPWAEIAGIVRGF